VCAVHPDGHAHHSCSRLYMMLFAACCPSSGCRHLCKVCVAVMRDSWHFIKAAHALTRTWPAKMVVSERPNAVTADVHVHADCSIVFQQTAPQQQLCMLSCKQLATGFTGCSRTSSSSCCAASMTTFGLRFKRYGFDQPCAASA